MEHEELKSRLNDYLTGMAGGDPANLADVIGCDDWQRLAAAELERRRAKVLSLFDGEILAAIASGDIDLAAAASKASEMAATA